MEENPNPKKRVRVSIACQSCRNRKSRCDGRQPNCMRCEELGTSCTYERSAVDAGISNLHLLSRLDALEKKLEASQRRPSVADPLSLQDHALGGETPPVIQKQPHCSQQTPTSSTRYMGTDHDNVDGMGAIQLTDDLDSSTYFGNSSNLALVGQISRALTHAHEFQSVRESSVARTSQSRPRSPIVNHHGVRPRSHHQENLESPSGAGLSYSIHFLPPEAEVIALFDEYFGTVGLFFPCIHQETFFATYKENHVSGFASADRIWLGLLYMIMSSTYGTRSYASPTKKAARMANFYYQKACEVAMPELLFRSSVDTVQLLCLMTSHLQGSLSSSQAWTFHCLSVKAATQIGLHSMETSPSLKPLEREIRKRTWFWCIIHDAILSVKLGRPPVTPKSAGALQSPIDVDDACAVRNTPCAVVAQSLDNYKATVSLSRLILNILSQLYGDNIHLQTDHSVRETLRLTFNFSLELEEWLSSVQEDLRPRHSSEPDLPRSISIQARRFRAILTLRFHGACALVHRPILFKLLEASTSTSDTPEILSVLRESGFPFLRKCISSCNENIAVADVIVNNWQDQNLVLSGAWWFTAFYVFNAALMLLSLLLLSKTRAVPGLFTLQETNAMRSSLRDAGRVLLGLNNENLVITRYSECLEQFLGFYDSLPALGTEGTVAESQSILVHPTNNNADLSFREGFSTGSLSSLPDAGKDDELGWLDTAWITDPISGGFASSSFDFPDGF